MKRAISLLSAAVGATLLSSPALATTLYWDSNGATAGTGTGTGTWSNSTTANANWTTDSTGQTGHRFWIVAPETTGATSHDAVFSADTTVNGTFTVTAASTPRANSITVEEGTVTVTGNIVLGAGATSDSGKITVASGATLTTTGTFSTGSVALIKEGPGVYEFTATSVPGLPVTVNAGTMKWVNPTFNPVGSATVAGIPNGSVLTVNSATLDVNGRRDYVGGFSLKNGAIINNSGGNNNSLDGSNEPLPGIGLIGGSGATATLESGEINTNLESSGAGPAGTGHNLNKTTSGVVKLTAANSWSGNSNINGGRLVVSGNLYAEANGATLADLRVITVNNGGTLAAVGTGSDTLYGAGTLGRTIVKSGGTFALGEEDDDTSIGLVRGRNSSDGFTPIGGFTLEAGGTFEIDLAGTTAGSGYDRLIVTAPNATDTPTSLAGNLSLDLVGAYTPNVGDLFFILVQQLSGGGAHTGVIQGTFAGLNDDSTFILDGVKFRISYDGDLATNSISGGNDVVLQVIPIPEPSSLLALCAGGLILAGRRRRAGRIE